MTDFLSFREVSSPEPEDQAKRRRTATDPILSASTDDGATWSEASKIHDDKFKISACPHVSAGLSVDSTGRLHAAWYTGTEAHPGVFYAAGAVGLLLARPGA